MKIARVYTGKDGRSHFEDVELPVESGTEGAEVSKPIRVRNAVFRASTPAANKSIGTLHAAQRRLLVVKLTGRQEIEVGDGTKRVFGPGDVHILDDTYGEGHLGRVLTKETVTLVLELEDDRA